MTISTNITAVYTMMQDENTVRMWVFIEDEQGRSRYVRELLRFQITRELMDQLPDEIVQFEFHVIPNARPPFEIENGGFWSYFQQGVTFSGESMLVPAVDRFIQEWKERTGQILE